MSKRAPQDFRQKRNTARAIFILNAILWLGYGVYIYYDMAVLNNNTDAADILTIFVLINAAAMLASGILLRKIQSSTYYFALAVVVFNTLLMLTNLFDLFFLSSFILDLIVFLNLTPLRKEYLPKP